jgi:hypothetical protein
MGESKLDFIFKASIIGDLRASSAATKDWFGVNL